MNLIKTNINWGIIKALAERDFRLYFTNPTGYVFITLFIFLSAASAFWQEQFFLNFLANLEQLNRLFPYLLLLFIPALSMGVWADERKQGTDELLLTLPGTDFEIVLGKYCAVLAIYTVALILSVSHVIVLVYLGSPDIGLMMGNYIGFWLIGAAFISVGMLASLLSPNATIAFILGAVACSFFTFTGQISGVFGEFLQRLIPSLGVTEFFNDFSRGVVSFSAILYFVSVTGLMIYLNVLFIGRRHWPLEADGYKMWMHHSIRAAAIIIAVISLNVLAGRAAFRLDVTAEQLHSLSDKTRDLLAEISSDRPVFIQAFISEEVPQPLVQTRENLIGFLREIDALAGDRVEVIIHTTEMYTDQARDAREKFGILPRDIPSQTGARRQLAKVFMGVAFTSGAEEEVIPFFDRGLPTEYELIRSISMVARSQRKRIGVVTTEAKIVGGFDYQTMKSNPSWQVVGELERQYEVIQISALEPITEDIDGLLVALPSTLPQDQMNNLAEYIEAGNPTLLLIDPLPTVNIQLAPMERPGANQNPFMQQQQPPVEKGDSMGLLRRLGVNWTISSIVWNTYNPHPAMAALPPEVNFLSASNNSVQSFNAEHDASSGLQELVMLYPGAIAPAADTNYDFIPLLRTGQSGGIIDYRNLVRRSFFGTQLAQGLPHYPTPAEYTLAAAIKSSETPGDSTKAQTSIDLIVIADIDFISSQFFEIRKMGMANLNFDNITFFLNCMDMLVNDESFIDMRKRRVRHRTLETVETKMRIFEQQRIENERNAESEAQVALSQAQQRLDQKVAEVQQRTDLDAQTKPMMAQTLQEDENRRFEALQANIESEKEAQIARSHEEMEAQVLSIQNTIKSMAVLIPPVPVLLMGIYIFVQRKKREHEGAVQERKLRS
jgi:ABC-2 type transport system permease protein